ncbi:MAG: GMP synthase [Candidatus Xenolissoclinum pacificiensis L6]|uniref:GMP synthase [glutamine-hydrolyzing] n=1 Tax=Candidatus Xenolissoclinum pacificiensis L6 TaxID=1401685 RepID=W2UYN4_9RICK|nr:MAG: GMP synthase [Candidatus Xenolissoclinum pacificiensis L6]
MLNEKHIAIIDFGSQYTMLIARRIREMKVQTLIYNTENFVYHENMSGIIISGGHESTTEHNYQKLAEYIFDECHKLYKIPILSICFGMQLMCDYYGAVITDDSSMSEYGATKITTRKSKLWENIDKESFTVWMSHQDSVCSIPKGFSCIASSPLCPIIALENVNSSIFAIQFHPEVHHTDYGNTILKNFLDICNVRFEWDILQYAYDKAHDIAKSVGSNKVLAAVSGGVDSTVATVLMHKIIGDRLTCVLVDNGLLRANEVQHVKDVFNSLNINLKVIDATHQFLQILHGVEDPEQKRCLIGKTFIDIFEKHLTDQKFLLQGTLYSDVIESGCGKSQTIKSHHNVGGLPKNMNLKLVEPLRSFFKDEVRQLGLLLGIKKDFLFCHPFPGPGLAVRIPGVVTREKIAILRKIDSIFIQILKSHQVYHEIWQAFAVLLPVLSVGVVGDNRTRGMVCVLRAVTSEDAMTADIYPNNCAVGAEKFWIVLNEASNRILNQIPEITRVLYDITSKPPGTIEWE